MTDKRAPMQAVSDLLKAKGIDLMRGGHTIDEIASRVEEEMPWLSAFIREVGAVASNRWPPRELKWWCRAAWQSGVLRIWRSLDGGCTWSELGEADVDDVIALPDAPVGPHDGLSFSVNVGAVNVGTGFTQPSGVRLALEVYARGILSRLSISNQPTSGSFDCQSSLNAVFRLWIGNLNVDYAVCSTNSPADFDGAGVVEVFGDYGTDSCESGRLVLVPVELLQNQLDRYRTGRHGSAGYYAKPLEGWAMELRSAITEELYKRVKGGPPDETD